MGLFHLLEQVKVAVGLVLHQAAAVGQICLGKEECLGEGSRWPEA